MKKSISQSINEMIHYQDYNKGIVNMDIIKQYPDLSTMSCKDQLIFLCTRVFKNIVAITKKSEFDIKKPMRTAEMHVIRTAYYIICLSKYPETPLEDISYIVSRDHATVIHSRDRFLNSKKYDLKFYQAVIGLLKLYEAEIGTKIMVSVHKFELKNIK